MRQVKRFFNLGNSYDDSKYYCYYRDDGMSGAGGQGDNTFPRNLLLEFSSREDMEDFLEDCQSHRKNPRYEACFYGIDKVEFYDDRR